MLETFDSIKEAAAASGLVKLSSPLSRHQKGNGYYWCYAEEADTFQARTQSRQMATIDDCSTAEIRASHHRSHQRSAGQTIRRRPDGRDAQAANGLATCTEDSREWRAMDVSTHICTNVLQTIRPSPDANGVTTSA